MHRTEISMKIKTKWFGSITVSETELQKFKGILQDAATYNLQMGYIKVHGDLMEEIKNIEVNYEQKPQRNISTTAQTKRSAGTSKTRRSKKQTGVHKESDNK